MRVENVKYFKMQYFLEAELFCCHPPDFDFAVTSEVVIKSEVTAKNVGKKKCYIGYFCCFFSVPKVFCIQLY